MDQDRMTVPEAAEALGITVDAVRKRIHRRTLTSEKATDGRVYVLLDFDHDTDTPRSEYDALKNEVIEDLRRQNEHLRGQLDVRTEELREHRRIIAGLTQRIPELVAASTDQPPQQPTHDNEGPARGPVPQDRQTATERPWWRRIFGG